MTAAWVMSGTVVSSSVDVVVDDVIGSVVVEGDAMIAGGVVSGSVESFGSVDAAESVTVTVVGID